MSQLPSPPTAASPALDADDAAVIPLPALTSSPTRPPLAKPLLAFALDAVLATVVMFALMMLFYVVWALARGVQLAARTGGALSPDALEAQLGVPGAAMLIAMTLISTGGAALLLYVWRRRASPTERAHSMAMARSARTWAWVSIAGLVTFALSTGITWIGREMGLEPNPSNLVLVEAGIAEHPVFLTLFAVVFAPLYEELLFRRVLFGRLWAAGWPVLGIVLSSLVFALAHEVPGLTGNPPLTTLLLIGVYAAMGAVFAIVYRATGTLWAPIATHMLNNALALGAMQVFSG